MAASFRGRSVLYVFTHSYSSIAHSFAVVSFDEVIMSIRSSEKFRLVTAIWCAWSSFSCLPLLESQTMTVPSSKIDTRVSSKGPHFTLVAFMGSASSMVNNFLAGSNCQTCIRFGTTPSAALLNLSLQVHTLF